MPTYYIDPVSGSDAAAGTSFGAAWATTQKALNTVAAGDEVRLCATGTETPAASLVPVTAGNSSSPITFVGYNAAGTSPLARGSHYTISGSSLAVNTHVLSAPLTTSALAWNRWHGVRFTGATGTGCGVRGDLYYWSMRRCRFDNNGEDGIRLYEDAGLALYDCDADNNGQYGIKLCEVSNRGDWSSIISCRIHNNTSDGLSIRDPAGVPIENCLVYRNGGVGVYLDSSGTGTGLHRCTIVNNTGDGVYWFRDPASHHRVTECIIASNGGYGINMNFSDRVGKRLLDRNLIYGNTSGGTNNCVSNDSLTSDPLFVDSANDDYTLSASSPAKGYGIGGQTIGALSATESGGGGGPTIY